MAAECNAVRAPVGDGLDVVYGVPNDGGGGYVARAGVNGRSQIVFADETDSGAVLAYTAAAGPRSTSRRARSSSRTGVAAPVTLVAAASHRRRRARRRGLGHGRRRGSPRAGSRGAWHVGVQGRHRRGDGRRPTRGPACGSARRRSADDGTVAFARARPPAGRQRAVRGRRRSRRARAGAIIAVSPAVPIRDADLLPRVAIHGTTVVYRLRDGAGGRWEAIRATDLVAGATRTIARVGRRAARMSDPAVDATRIVWSQADFRAGRFVRSRILRVRVAL